jgi:hypothetical protein
VLHSQHSGDRGDHAEASVRELLSRYLPRSFDVGQGEIIDSHGLRSGQTAVVITGPEHPPTFEPGKPGLFFIEGVRAAGEVKSQLTSSHLDHAIQGGARFKRLTAETEGNLAVEHLPDLDRFARQRPYFLLAFESELTVDTVVERIQRERDVSNDANIDGAFLLDRGFAIDVGTGQGALRAVDTDGQAIAGWMLSHKRTESVLFDFVGWLACVMPTLWVAQPVLPRYLVPDSPSEPPQG